MLLYCLKCRNNMESKNPRVEKTKNERMMLSLNCVVCGSKKLKFFKKPEVKGFSTDLLEVITF